jgi:hypothetical protein
MIVEHEQLTTVSTAVERSFSVDPGIFDSSRFILLYQSHIDYPLQSDAPCGRGAGRLIEHVFMAVLRVGGRVDSTSPF